MTNNPLSFGDAKPQGQFEVIPNKTSVKVRMFIKPGYYDDRALGLTNGWGTKNDKTGSVYLKVEYEVLEGEYKHRKIFGLIGMHSNKGPEWRNMGKTFIMSLLMSARNVRSDDKTPETMKKLDIKDFGELNNLVFAGVVSVTVDNKGNNRNELKYIITPDDARYETVMGTLPSEKKFTVDDDFDDEIPFAKVG